VSMTRRDFVQSAIGLAALPISGEWQGMAQQPAPATTAPKNAPAGPVVIASGNGLAACGRAMERLRAKADPLDAIVAGVNLVEDDPSDHSVGLGGLPNEDGVVELDASVMHGPTHKAGAVAALQRIRNPSSVAVLVMRRTDHVLLVGEGALRFARAHGFKEQDLLTDEARQIWLHWKETHSENDDWLHPEAGPEASRRWEQLRQEGRFTWGTINCLARTASGDLAGVTSTSGLSYKLPGRVGDSPIIGAGLYVDNDVGAAGSTGRGEANLQNLSSFMAVEFMRQGRSPEDACLEVLRRALNKAERRLVEAPGVPRFDLTMYALRKDGQFGGATLRGKASMSVHDGREARLVPLAALTGR
jgi:N4-(beta-N-acetylglucosaminyl)-L-asparaginase